MRLVVFFFLCTILMSSCATVSFHDGAVYDQELSNSLINRLKIDTLLVVFPTYHDKERILKSTIAKYPYKKASLLNDLEELKTQQEIELQHVVNAFSVHLQFCPYLLIPDSLVHAFENGEERAFFLGPKNTLDPQITYKKKDPIKFIHRNESKWDMRIGNELLPNPFPNYISYRNGLLELLGVEDYSDIVNSIASALNRRLEQFYRNPNRAVRY